MFSVLLLLLLGGLKFNSEEGKIDNFQTRFERVIITEKSVERTSGILYFTVPGTVHAVVTYPVRQHLIVHDRMMTIYYPLEHKAFVIQSESLLELPFVNSFMLGLRRDFGLSELGFEMDFYRLYNDTLDTYWKPKHKNPSLQNRAMLRSIGKSLVSVETSDSSQSSSSVLLFDNFIETPLGKPMATSFTKTVNTPKEQTKEQLTFDKLQFNTTFPDSIMKFQLPPNTTIERVNW
jgi:outer membrane lipoprotein-sorting protein